VNREKVSWLEAVCIGVRQGVLMFALILPMTVGTHVQPTTTQVVYR